jgi:hypothetical protein
LKFGDLFFPSFCSLILQERENYNFRRYLQTLGLRRGKRGLFFEGSTLIEDTLNGIGAGIFNDILSDYKPSSDIYFRKDLTLLDVKRFHLLQAEEEIAINHIIGTDEQKHYF